MAPSSRLAASSNPNVAYLESNFPALLKKQTTLPSLAYAGIPYQVFGHRSGAVASTISWSRLAMTRSDPFIAAIAASRSRSPSALFLLARASAFSSWARAFIAARSSAVNPLDVVLRAVALFADFCVSFVAGFFSAISKHPFQEEDSAQRDDARSHRRCPSRLLDEPIGEIAQHADPCVVVDPPVATVANDHGAGVRGDVHVLPEVPQRVEAPRPLDVDPPEILVGLGRVGARVGGRCRPDPLLGDDAGAVAFASVQEQLPEASVVDRCGVQAALHLLEARLPRAQAPGGAHLGPERLAEPRRHVLGDGHPRRPLEHHPEQERVVVVVKPLPRWGALDLRVLQRQLAKVRPVDGGGVAP